MKINVENLDDGDRYEIEAPIVVNVVEHIDSIMRAGKPCMDTDNLCYICMGYTRGDVVVISMSLRCAVRLASELEILIQENSMKGSGEL